MHDHTELRAGDVGTVLEFEIRDETGAVHDLTGCTVTVRVERPDRTTVEWPLVITDAAGGVATYTTKEGDISQAGTWRFQPIVESAAGLWHGTIERRRVWGNVRAPV